MTEETIDTRAVWYCIQCHHPTPLDDVVIRTASGRCMCATCWKHELRDHPIDAHDLDRALALVKEPAVAEEPPPELLGYPNIAEGCD